MTVPGVGVFNGRIRVVCNPLEEDEKDEVAEDENEKDELRDELQQDLSVLPAIQLVPKTQGHTENLKNYLSFNFEDLHILRHENIQETTNGRLLLGI